MSALFLGIVAAGIVNIAWSLADDRMTELTPEAQAHTLDIFTRRSSSSLPPATTAAPEPPAGAASTTTTTRKEGSEA